MRGRMLLAGAVVLGLVAVAAETSWSQPAAGIPEAAAAQSGVDPAPVTDFPQAPVAGAATADQPAAPPDEAEELRQRFTDLATRRAAAMTADELRAAVGEAERALEEQTARAELRRATQILETLVMEHPETQAAKEAQRALGALNQSQETPIRKRSTPANPFGDELFRRESSIEDPFKRESSDTRPSPSAASTDLAWPS